MLTQDTINQADGLVEALVEARASTLDMIDKERIIDTPSSSGRISSLRNIASKLNDLKAEVTRLYS